MFEPQCPGLGKNKTQASQDEKVWEWLWRGCFDFRVHEDEPHHRPTHLFSIKPRIGGASYLNPNSGYHSLVPSSVLYCLFSCKH